VSSPRKRHQIPTENLDWEDITPDSLLNAVKHIRERFEWEHFRFSFHTEQMCYKELHPVAISRNASAVFKQYMDVYEAGLKKATENEFRELLDIGLANSRLINGGPIEWAKLQLELLISGKERIVGRWIKSCCDQQEPSKTTTPEDMDEFVYWRTWRAPKFVHMQPSGNTPYDPPTAWSREDEERTDQILHALSERFLDSVRFYLEKIAGEAYVRLAKEGRQIDQRQPLLRSSTEVTPEGTPDEDRAHAAFISYSWDSEQHKRWVLELATRLRAEGGVQIILDRWHLPLGGDKNVFMEKSIAASKFVVLICTSDYARSANQRTGGVGYEATIITAELAEDINQAKFIPVLRSGDWKSSLPAWIKSKRGVDLRGNPYSEEQYQELLRGLHQQTLEPPPVGPKPKFGDRNTKGSESAPPLQWSTAESSDPVRPKPDPENPNAIFYARYETKSEDARKANIYIRRSSRSGWFIFENSYDDELHGPREHEGPIDEIAQRLAASNQLLLMKGYVRMNYANLSGHKAFDL
jgi:hypothetical protein